MLNSFFHLKIKPIYEIKTFNFFCLRDKSIQQTDQFAQCAFSCFPFHVSNAAKKLFSDTLRVNKAERRPSADATYGLLSRTIVRKSS